MASLGLLQYKPGDHPVPGYTLVRQLGQGAMGAMWLAKSESGFEHALKVVDLRAAGGRKEYRGLATFKKRRLRHANLLPLHDYWLVDADGNVIPDSQDHDMTTGGKLAPDGQSMVQMAADDRAAETVAVAGVEAAKAVQLIVAMELGDKTLTKRLEECRDDGEGGIPQNELLKYMEQAAQGLDYLHQQNIFHRDIKPQNIMLVGGVAKVCDYGLAVTIDSDLMKTSHAYTPYYASPEVMDSNRGRPGGHSDQYSLAVSYVELRTGRLPYSSTTAPAVYMAKMTGEYDLSKIENRAVHKVLERAFAKDPRQRFASCAEFVQALAQAERTPQRPKSFWTLVRSVWRSQ